MSIGPVRPVNGFAPHQTRTAASASSSSRARSERGEGGGASAIMAEEQEKASRDRISYANEAAREAEREADLQIRHIKDVGEERRADENLRQETAIEDQKRKGYESLQKLKREQAEELTRIKNEGEASTSFLRRHYAQESYAAETQGRKAVQDAEARSFSERETVTRRNKYEQDLIAKEHSKRLEESEQSHREKFEAVANNNQAEYERYKQNAETARQKNLESTRAQLGSLQDEHATAVDRANERASGILNQLQADSTRKLAAYADRAQDPFYRMVSLDTRLIEQDDAFLLTARVPVHEQGGISVSIHGDQLVVSGHRKSHEERTDGPGEKMTTSGFQSYSQTIPLPWPVDARSLSREFQGDTLRVRIPKKDFSAQYQPYRKPTPEARTAHAKPPRFPENLPKKDPPDPSADGS